MEQGIIRPLSDARPRPVVSHSAPRQGMNLRVMRSIRMHRSLALAVFAVVTTAVLGYAFTRRPLYMAHSIIYVQPATPKPLTDVTSGFYDSSRYDSYIQQQLQTIVRDDILADALRSLPAGTWRQPGESEESAIARLKGAIKVERELSSFEVTISMTGSDAKTVTSVVNAITHAFLTKGRGDELVQSDQQLQSLTADRQQIMADLEKDRQEQAGLSSSLGVADTASTTTGNPFDVQLQQLRTQVAEARAAHDTAVAQLAAASRGEQAGEMMNAASDEVAATDPSLGALKVAITERRTALTTQMAGMTEANPLYKKDQEELARLDQSQANLAQKLRKNASALLAGKWNLEVARTAAVESRLEGQLAQQTSIATGATPKLQRASDLAADIQRLQTRYTETDNAIHSLALLENASGLVHLSLPATQSQKTPGSKKGVLLALAIPLGLLCGLFAAVAAEKLDPRVYIAEDVGKVLEFEPMAVLPDSYEVAPAVMDEYLLRLVAGIDQAHRLGNAKTFIFTAASPGMRTSGLVEVLAQKMHRIGYKVVVSKASAALKSVAAAGAEGDDAAVKPMLGGGGDAQLLRVKQQGHAVEKLKEFTRDVDMLFIDALPILCSAEAEFDTRLVDVTVLLAESGRTTRRELSRSLSLIRRLTTAGIAAVLVDLHLRHADWDFLSGIESARSAG